MAETTPASVTAHQSRTVFHELPDKVRDSVLLKALEQKLPADRTHDFAYAAEFCGLYRDIKTEVAELPRLFPEYTPHNCPNHLDRLFPLADELLGNEFFDALTCDELFLLAVGLIAHDWGMAVGSEEIDALIAGGQPEYQKEGFALLNDEAEQLSRYVAELRLPRDASGRCSALVAPRDARADEDPTFASDARFAVARSPLPEYIRRTHAWRSGARLRKRWGNAYPYLAEAAAEVCIGHWLDLPKIDTQMPFASPRALFGPSAPPNLRAVAVAVRLTDLFDVGIDRTPFALWRYIRPRDRISKREWNKHRCLAPVTFRPDDHGQRAPVLAGDVHDHDVWAALQDLHRYCEEQLRGCSDLMRRHHHSDKIQRGRGLPWTLRPEVIFEMKPHGFVPCNIRFEFEREKILELLASTIYGGDTHVFLRELLQNAIDATRLRRDRQSKDPGSRPPRGTIYFTVEHGKEGDAKITCRDYGIGMDEETVRNYLAKAGASFWQSDQFRSLEAGFTPIGRFGIGLLSCFSVADEVKILTRRYDWPDPKSPALKIFVPHASQQFRVEHAGEATPYGTEVTVHVRGEKLREQWRLRHAVEAAKQSPEQHPAPALEVTSYLKCIAGFVRFPIVVDENGSRTVIVHPDYETLPETHEDGNVIPALETEAKRLGLKWMGQHRLQRDFPWEEITRNPLPSDERAAYSHRIIDLVGDLTPELSQAGYEGYEGWMAFPEPLELDEEFVVGSRSLAPASIYRINSFEDTLLELDLDIHSLRVHAPQLPAPKEAPSARRSWTFGVYRDGLLVSQTVLPELPHIWGGTTLCPRLILNIPSHSVDKLDPSRSHFHGWDRDWADFLWKAIQGWLLRNRVVPTILAATTGNGSETLCRRFFQLGRLGQFYGLPADWLAHQVPAGEFPIPWLEPGGTARLSLGDEAINSPLWTAPHQNTFLPDSVLVSDASSSLEDNKERLKYWRDANRWLPSLDWFPLNSALCAWNACALHIGLGNKVAETRWLVPPVPWMPPVIQYRWCATVDDARTPLTTITEQLLTAPTEVSMADWSSFWDQINRIVEPEFGRLRLATFSAPNSSLFSTGEETTLNSNHPAVQWLLRVFVAFWKRTLSTDRDLKPNRDTIERIEDLINQLCSGYYDNDRRLAAELQDTWVQFSAAVEADNLLPSEPTPPCPSQDEFNVQPYDPEANEPQEYEDGERDPYGFPTQLWGYPLPPDWKPGQKVPPPI